MIPSANAAAGTPSTPGFAASIDRYSPRQSEAGCDNSVKPGTRALGGLLARTYPGHTIYYGRDCSVGADSGHKLGRAIDFMTRDSTQQANGRAFVSWLLATDAYGNKQAMARRLGVMYVIYNRVIWKSYNASAGWQPYYGSSPHTDHVHISLSREGGARTTSFWSGSAAASTTGGGDIALNGTFVRAADTGRIYRVAGGAPMWLSTCVEGCPVTVHTSQAAIDARPKVPADNTTLQAIETGRVYKIAGGAPLWLGSCAAAVCGSPVRVNQWTIDALDHLRPVPADNTTLQTVDTGGIYKVAGGAPVWLSSCAAECGSPVLVDQATINRLDHLRAVPADNTTLFAAETGRIYKVAGGAPLWLSSCAAECGSPVRVNQGSIDRLDHLRAVPADNTTLFAAETGRIYRVRGGVPTWLGNCDGGICGSPVKLNQWTIDSRDHLRR